MNNSRLPNNTVTKIALDISEGTEILDRFYDSLRMAEAIVLYNPAWSVVKLGEVLPEITPIVTYTIVAGLDKPTLDYKAEALVLKIQMLKEQQQQKTIHDIEVKTEKKVHTIKYCPEMQQTIFFDVNNFIIENIPDSDRRNELKELLKKAEERYTSGKSRNDSFER